MVGKKTKAGQSRLTSSFGVSKRGAVVGKDLRKPSDTKEIQDNSKVEGIFTKPGLVEVKPETAKTEKAKTKDNDELPTEPTEVKPSLQADKPQYERFLKSLVKDRISQPIHQEEYNTAEKILRQFDMTDAYGPTAGISRLDRWNRANKLGQNPPPLVKEILDTEQGSSDSKYSESYLYGYV